MSKHPTLYCQKCAKPVKPKANWEYGFPPAGWKCKCGHRDTDVIPPDCGPVFVDVGEEGTLSHFNRYIAGDR